MRRATVVLIGYVAGMLLAIAIFAAADHVAHHRDALGIGPEILLGVALPVLGGLIGGATHI